jgi:hypothetical protein
MRNSDTLHPIPLLPVVLHICFEFLPPLPGTRIPIRQSSIDHKPPLMLPDALLLPFLRVCIVRLYAMPIPVRERFVVGSFVRNRSSGMPP